MFPQRCGDVFLPFLHTFRVFSQVDNLVPRLGRVECIAMCCWVMTCACQRGHVFENVMESDGVLGGQALGTPEYQRPIHGNHADQENPAYPEPNQTHNTPPTMQSRCHTSSGWILARRAVSFHQEPGFFTFRKTEKRATWRCNRGGTSRLEASTGNPWVFGT